MVQNKKAKGSNAERELVHNFWSNGWAASRMAGSGSIRLPSPDIIAGNPLRTLAIECKVTKSSTQYFSQKEIEDLNHFAQRLNAEPWVAVKFNRDAWYFLPTSDLEATDSQHKLTQDRAKSLGHSFVELIK